MLYHCCSIGECSLDFQRCHTVPLPSVHGWELSSPGQWLLPGTYGEGWLEIWMSPSTRFGLLPMLWEATNVPRFSKKTRQSHRISKKIKKKNSCILLKDRSDHWPSAAFDTCLLNGWYCSITALRDRSSGEEGKKRRECKTRLQNRRALLKIASKLCIALRDPSQFVEKILYAVRVWSYSVDSDINMLVMREASGQSFQRDSCGPWYLKIAGGQQSADDHKETLGAGWRRLCPDGSYHARLSSY